MFLPAKRGGKAMDEIRETKASECRTLKSECEFFDLIEKKMKEQGFEVLETSNLQREKKSIDALALRYFDRFAF